MTAFTHEVTQHASYVMTSAQENHFKRYVFGEAVSLLVSRERNSYEQPE